MCVFTCICTYIYIYIYCFQRTVHALLYPYPFWLRQPLPMGPLRPTIEVFWPFEAHLRFSGSPFWLRQPLPGHLWGCMDIIVTYGPFDAPTYFTAANSAEVLQRTGCIAWTRGRPNRNLHDLVRVFRISTIGCTLMSADIFTYVHATTNLCMYVCMCMLWVCSPYLSAPMQH